MKPLLFIISITYAIITNLQTITNADPNYNLKTNNNRFIFLTDDEDNPESIDLYKKPVKVKVEPTDITYYLFTQINDNNPFEITNSNIDLLENSNFDSTKLSFFIIHGWHSSNTSSVNKQIRPALLEKHDINVFVVDWSGLAQHDYITLHIIVPEIGEMIASFINSIQSKYNLNGTQFVIVAHSLGCHVAGCTGAAINNKVSVIIGLDPAGPLYLETDINNRLDPTDANFVHIIHTNAILLGIQFPVGHADYYPNGGFFQPGCEDNISSCSHARPVAYYAESIERGNVFPALQCEEYADYLNGKCNNVSQSYLGLFQVDQTAHGKYYLKTNSEAPYGQG